jgi:mannan endo-1,4-beta-mannosidase
MRNTFLLLSLFAASPRAVLPPSDPHATPGAAQLYTYLQNLSGQGILSGQLSMLNDSIVTTASSVTSFRDRYVMARDGGKLPALYASNFGDWPMDYQGAIVSTMEGRWKVTGGKSVFMLCWHAVQPDTPSSVGYSGMSRFSAANPYPSWKIDSILKPGTALNIEWFKRLDTTASYLKQLDSAGIPVLWRPFHENNGAFFWWGQQPRFKELWQQMYHYYVDSLHLDNLLWVYSVTYFPEGDPWVDSLYPGDKYVDVLGADIYKGSYGQDYDPWVYTKLLQKGNGKPIGITENGTMPGVPDLKYTQPKWTFFCTWWGYEVDTMWANAYYHPAGFTIQNPDSLYKAVYGDPYTVTQDRIDWGIAPDDHVFLTASCSPSNGGSVVVSPDSNGRYTAGTRVTATAVPASGWDFTAWSGDTAASTSGISFSMAKDFAIQANFRPRLGTNLLINGNFAGGLVGWSFSPWEPSAVATDSAIANEFRTVITGTPSDIYGIQLLQTGIVLDSGATYRLGYTARASSAREVDVAVGQDAGAYAKLLYDTATVGTVSQVHSWTFLDTLPSSNSLRLEFELGKATGTVWLDSIQIAMVSGPTGLRSAGLAGSGPLFLERRGNTVGWALPSPLEEDAQVRLIGLDGTLFAKENLSRGMRTGRILGIGSGQILVVDMRTTTGKRIGSGLLAP